MRRGVAQREPWARARERARVVSGLAGGLAATAALTGCGGLTSQHEDLGAGKTQFVAKCGACHTLDRAGTKGTTGPNLDQAFQRARKDGEGESTFEGVVRGQIKEPSRLPQFDPVTGRALAKMPANLVTGDAASDVAAYVAS